MTYKCQKCKDKGYLPDKDGYPVLPKICDCQKSKHQFKKIDSITIDGKTIPVDLEIQTDPMSLTQLIEEAPPEFKKLLTMMRDEFNNENSKAKQ